MLLIVVCISASVIYSYLIFPKDLVICLDLPNGLVIFPDFPKGPLIPFLIFLKILYFLFS